MKKCSSLATIGVHQSCPRMHIVCPGQIWVLMAPVPANPITLPNSQMSNLQMICLPASWSFTLRYAPDSTLVASIHIFSQFYHKLDQMLTLLLHLSLKNHAQSLALAMIQEFAHTTSRILATSPWQSWHVSPAHGLWPKLCPLCLSGHEQEWAQAQSIQCF
jgi:hypothetical protein